MNNNGISRFQFDGAMAMMERTNRRLWIVTLVLIALLIVSNVLWLIFGVNK